MRHAGCYGHRTAIVEEVMKYLEVENLGACLKNADYCALFPYCCRTPFHGTLHEGHRPHLSGSLMAGRQGASLRGMWRRSA